MCLSCLACSLKALPGCRAAGTVVGAQSLCTLLIPVSTARAFLGPGGQSHLALRQARGAGSLVTEQFAVKDETDVVSSTSQTEPSRECTILENALGIWVEEIQVQGLIQSVTGWRPLGGLMWLLRAMGYPL